MKLSIRIWKAKELSIPIADKIAIGTKIQARGINILLVKRFSLENSLAFKTLEQEAAS